MPKGKHAGKDRWRCGKCGRRWYLPKLPEFMTVTPVICTNCLGQPYMEPDPATKPEKGKP